MSFLKGIFSKSPASSFPGEMLDHDASKLDYVVIDCEMTGLNSKKDRLLSIAAVKISQGKILSNDTFYKVIFQEAHVLREETILIHRLNHQQVSNGQNQEAVINDLIIFCQGYIPVGHFFDIDLGFLSPLLPKPFSYPHVDTRWIANYLLCDAHTNELKLDLESLCKRYSIPSFQAHNALGDATATACLFIKLLAELRHKQLVSFDSVLASIQG
jgi:DNA polymerase III subunit epsilon